MDYEASEDVNADIFYLLLSTRFTDTLRLLLALGDHSRAQSEGYY